MQSIDIYKKANGYLVEINGDYGKIEEEVYLYKTREEMEADLPNLVQRAHEINVLVLAEKAKEKTGTIII